MNLATKVVLVLIALHLILGFGWLVYKLSPRGDKDGSDQSNSKEDSTEGAS
jgi:flagellar biogenesis protein FliO